MNFKRVVLATVRYAKELAAETENKVDDTIVALIESNPDVLDFFISLVNRYRIGAVEAVTTVEDGIQMQAFGIDDFAKLISLARAVAELLNTFFERKPCSAALWNSLGTGLPA